MKGKTAPTAVQLTVEPRGWTMSARWALATILLCSFAWAGEPTEMDREEAKAFLELARKAFEGKQYDKAKQWLDRAEAKYTLPEIWELQGHIRVRDGDKAGAIPLYLKAREAYRGRDKEAFERVTREIRLISPVLAEYLGKKDAFVREAKLLVSGYRVDEFAKAVAVADLKALEAKFVASEGGLGVREEEPANKDVKKPGPTARTVMTLATVQKLFKGRVIKFDPRTLWIELYYDFENPDQMADWEFHPTAEPRLEKGELVIFGKMMSRGGLWKVFKARLRARFRPPIVVQATAHNVGDRLGEIFLCLFPEGGWDNGFKLGLGQRSNKDVPRVAAGRRYSLSVSLTAKQFESRVDNRVHRSEAVQPAAAWFYAVLWTDENHWVAYDNVWVRGVIDKDWLEKALRGQPNPPKPVVKYPALNKKVSLKKPYPKSYSTAPTDRISVQYAVIELLKQVEMSYDWNESRKNADPLTRRWVYPNIQGKPCHEALDELLGPLGLDYEIKNDKVVLKRK